MIVTRNASAISVYGVLDFVRCLHASYFKMKSFMRYSSEISKFALAKALEVGECIIMQFC